MNQYPDPYQYPQYSEEPQQPPVPSVTNDVMSYPMAPEQQQTVEQLRYLLGAEDLAEYLNHYWSGEREDKATGKWTRRFDPYINEKGRGELIGVLIMYLDKHPKLACLNEAQIAAIAEQFAWEAVWLLLDHEEEWEINPKFTSMLYDQIVDDVIVALNIGKDGRMLAALKNTMQFRETRTIGKQGDNGVLRKIGGIPFLK